MVSPFGFVSPGKNRRPAESIHVRRKRDPVTRGPADNGILLNAIEPELSDGKRGGRSCGSDHAAPVVANRHCRCRHVRRVVVTMVQKLICARLTVNYFFAVRMVLRSSAYAQLPDDTLRMQRSTAFRFVYKDLGVGMSTANRIDSERPRERSSDCKTATSAARQRPTGQSWAGRERPANLRTRPRSCRHIRPGPSAHQARRGRSA